MKKIKKIENKIVEAELCEENGKEKWILVGKNQRTFRTEKKLLDFLSQDGWTGYGAIKMPAMSDIVTEVYKYYFWRPKQKY